MTPTSFQGDVEWYRRKALESGGPVLELGCGTGRITLPLARAGVRIHALDASESMLASLRAKLADEPSDVRARVHPVAADMRTFTLSERFALVMAQTDVRTDVTEPALTDLMAELARLRDELVATKEFDDKRRGIVASFALSLESAPAVLNLHLTRWLYGLPLDYWDTVPARTMAVTPAQVQAAARKYLDPSRLQIVAAGDPSKISDLLKKFGTVETYDASGVRK